MICQVPESNSTYYQVGVVAWGIECGIEDVPGVYANVIRFRSWIDQKMNDLGYGTESYTYKLN